MQIVVLANDSLRLELLGELEHTAMDIVWVEHISALFENKESDVFIDLLFEEKHLDVLQQLIRGLIIVNSVERSLAEINSSFVRINGWPTFLSSGSIEAAALNEDAKRKAEEIFSGFNKKLEWVPDEPGFITPRVISMIINEAFIALKEGVSTKEEIDVAMKLGTNYPYGPFEWAEKIGIDRIKALLEKLYRQKERYAPFIFT